MRFLLIIVLLFIQNNLNAKFFDVSDYTLKNGLRIIVIPNQRVPAVAHSIWYKVGSADEPIGKSGIAHFTEHLLFKGTEKLKPGEFSKIVAVNGGRENAFTSKNYTGYFQLIHKSKLELVMSLEADRMKNIKLSKADFKNEKTVVLEERYSRVDNNPSALLSEQMNSSLYMNHPYRKPTIGWEHEIKNLNYEDVMSFYNKFYSPNNAILVICGDVNLDEVVKLAKKYFGGIESSEIEERNWASEPEQHAPRKIILKSKNTAISKFKRLYLAPTFIKSKNDSLTLEVFTEIFGNPSTGMLFEEFVKKKKLATSAAAYYYPDGFGHTSFVISIIPKKNIKLEEIEQNLDQYMKTLENINFDKKEVDLIKKRLVNDAIFAQDSLYMGMRIFGSSLTSGYSLDDIKDWPIKINEVSIDNLEKLMPSFFDINKSVTGYLIPISD